MPRSRSCIALVAGALLLSALAPGARGDQEALGKGTFIPSGSKVSAQIGNTFHAADDVDDFTVDGYAGQTLAITVVVRAEPFAPRGARRITGDRTQCCRGGHRLPRPTPAPQSTGSDLGERFECTRFCTPCALPLRPASRRGR